MSKEQIEEMAKVIADFAYKQCEDVPFYGMRAIYDSFCRAEVVSCMCCKIARGLTDAGYRKQSEGEWITKGDELKNTTCSVCGHWVETPYGMTPYCPNCGAKMKGGE